MLRWWYERNTAGYGGDWSIRLIITKRYPGAFVGFGHENVFDMIVLSGCIITCMKSVLLHDPDGLHQSSLPMPLRPPIHAQSRRSPWFARRRSNPREHHERNHDGFRRDDDAVHSTSSLVSHAMFTLVGGCS